MNESPRDAAPDDLARLLAYYDTNARRNMVLDRVAALAVIVLGASIGLLGVLKAPAWVAAVAGFIVVVAEGAAAKLGWAESRVRFRVAAEALRRVSLKLRLDPGLPEEERRALVGKILEIVAAENDAWKAVMEKEPGRSGSAGGSFSLG